MKPIQMKSWVMDEAQRLGLTVSAVRSRIYRGKYKLKLWPINRRLIYVLV